MNPQFLTGAQAARLAELCARYRVRRLSLFGSAAAGGFDPSRSDMDLAVDFDSPINMGLAEQFFGFQDEAAEVLGRHVDLLERSAISNPYLRRAIESEEVVVTG